MLDLALPHSYLHACTLTLTQILEHIAEGGELLAAGADAAGADAATTTEADDTVSAKDMTDKDISRLRCALEALTTRMSGCLPSFIKFAQISCKLACAVAKQVPDLALPELCAATLKILKIFAPSRIHANRPRSTPGYSHAAEASAEGANAGAPSRKGLNRQESSQKVSLVVERKNEGDEDATQTQLVHQGTTRIEVYLSGTRALELLLCADGNLQLLHDQGVTGVLCHAFRSFQSIPDTGEKLKLPLLETLTAGMVKMVCSTVVIAESGIMGGGSSGGSVSKNAIKEMNDEGMYPLMTQLASHFCGELEFLHMTAENVKQEMHKSRHSTPRGSVASVSLPDRDGLVSAKTKKGEKRDSRCRSQLLYTL
jgi:hypothetical protein